MVEPEFVEILKEAKENIYAFHSRQVRNSFLINEKDGVIIGQKVIPIEKVGLYVPGGTAAYPSSVLMNCIPAKIAGCSEIVMVSPPTCNGRINPVILAAAKIAASRNIPIFIDPAPADKDHQLENLPFVEIFSPNEIETAEYTGITPSGADSALRAALALYKKVKCRYVVIKQGGRGAFIYDGKHYSMVPAIKADKVVDTTAAGDSFTAAMTLEYLRTGGDIKAAVKYGCAAGAIAVSRKGASTSVPTEEEVRAQIPASLNMVSFS